MISLLIFALFSTAISFDFPTFKTSVTWPTSNSKNITTNLPFQVSAVFQFPSWATTKTMHPLTVDNPGPRTDSYLMQLSLVNPADSEQPLRMIFQQEIAAFNGEWSANAGFILPSYLIEMGKEEQEFAFSIKLSNLDQIMDVIASWTTKSVSPPFTLQKLDSATALPEQLALKVEDSVFRKDGDGKGSKTVSLYWGMWSTSSGPQKQLIKSVFVGTGEAISLESLP